VVREIERVTEGQADAIRVVIVDDHASLRDLLRVAFELAGVSVVGETGNGDDALRVVAEVTPDVVLMDVTMPGLDGITATRMIRERFPGTLVVMLTMHDDPQLVVDAVRAGVAAYITKGYDVADVVQTVRALAEGGTLLSPELAASMMHELTAEASGGPALTEPESDVLRLTAANHGTREVAALLDVSVRTVRNHLSAIYGKLDARDRTEAVVTGVRQGIIALA
jgi:two-component system, NarL family, response regulator DegU